jgi:uncharacterized protein with NRDE domain
MCLIFIIADQHPEFPLIIAANRDEYYSRPTASAHFWPDKAILAGKDLLAGGTWLGVTPQGRFAAVTNFRQPHQVPDQAMPQKSRGLLVTDFLESHLSPEEYLATLAKKQQEYAGFNALFGTLAQTSSRIHYFSNQDVPTFFLENGIYGLSNALLDTPWHKVTLGKTRIGRLLQKDFDIEEWMETLRDDKVADDNNLPDTGISLKTERFLSPMFIAGNDYGTRCSTVITVSSQGILNFFERTYIKSGICTNNTQFSFGIIP